MEERLIALHPELCRFTLDCSVHKIDFDPCPERSLSLTFFQQQAKVERTKNKWSAESSRRPFCDALIIRAWCNLSSFKRWLSSEKAFKKTDLLFSHLKWMLWVWLLIFMLFFISFFLHNCILHDCHTSCWPAEEAATGESLSTSRAGQALISKISGLINRFFSFPTLFSFFWRWGDHAILLPRLHPHNCQPFIIH